MGLNTKWLVGLSLAAGLTAAPQPRRRITLNVIAFDSHGQVVSDLTRKDFKVSDEGKAQSITSLRSNAVPQTSLRNPPGTPAVPPPVVILFDLLNDNLGNREYGVQEIGCALEHLELSDSLYLYLLTNQASLKPVWALPDPSEPVELEKTPWTEHIRPLLDAAINSVYGLRDEGVYYSPATFQAIDALATALLKNSYA